MFNDDIDDEPPCEVAPFVGRDKERESIKLLLGHTARAVQLTGQPMVGKGRLAEQISKELQQEMTAKERQLMCYYMCCRDMSSFQDILSCLSACLSLEETAQDKITLIKKFQEIVNSDKKCCHLFVFLKCENIHKKNFDVQFKDIVEKLMQVSNRVFVIITTQKSFVINQARQMKIEPLSKEDTVLLVRRYAPDVDVDEYKVAIEKHCCGLPPLAMDAAKELVKAHGIRYSAEEFDELLSSENRSKRVHSEDDLFNSEAMRQFEGLNDYLKQRIVDISIFKGSFRVEDVLSMLGNNRVEAKKNLVEMRNTGLVDFKDGGERMQLQSVIAHYVRNLMGSHVAYDDTVRLRFVTLFVDVLKKADTELFVKPQQTVFGYLHDDWPNLKQVLEEAIHCTENTYPVFLQVAMSAENLLVKCFPGEAVKFYEAMMYASTRFGTREECAMQKGLLGMAKTIGKGTDLVDAMGLFKEALPILRDGDNTESLVSLLADMGLNYNRQGKNTKSRNFYLQALEESNRCCDGRKLTNRVINIRCYLAIPLIFLEHFDEAENMLKETLDEARKCAPYHPAIPIMINSLGLIYERAGRGDDEALQYYTNSLAERRKYAGVAPGELVVVLNNVGMQHSKRGNHDYGLQLLSEARDIRMKLDRVNYHTALTCWNMGQVYARKHETENALKEVKDALEIFKKCTKDHFVIVEVSLLAAHLTASLGQHEESEKFLVEALEMEERFKEYMPSSVHIMLVLQHLVMTYLAWKPKCSPFLDRAVAEVTRLTDITRPYESMERYNRYMQQKEALYRVRAALDQQSLSGDMVRELLQEMVGFCYICTELGSNGEDVVGVFQSMTTNICESLARAERLLRSPALRIATQVLRNASGQSDSPPVSPTQDVSDPPSFYMNNQILRPCSADSSIASPFFVENDVEAMRMTPSLQIRGHTYLKEVIQARPYNFHACRENAYPQYEHFPNGNIPLQTSTAVFRQQQQVLEPCYNMTNADALPISGKSGSEFQEQKQMPGSLGINVALLQETVKMDVNKREDHAEEPNISKMKTVDETLPATYRTPSVHCTFDPTLRYPPTHRFPTIDRVSHREQSSRTERSETYSSCNGKQPSVGKNGGQHADLSDFRAKLAKHTSIVASLHKPISVGRDDRSSPISCGSRGHSDMLHARGSSGYETTATDGGCSKKRLSESSQLSSAPTTDTSGACSKSPSEHDDRKDGGKSSCKQSDCFCSYSRDSLH